MMAAHSRMIWFIWEFEENCQIIAHHMILKIR